MPYTKKQRNLANAIEHGFKPTGKAKGFTKAFAEQVITEEDARGKRSRQGRASFMGGAGTKIAPK
jgi:hypothetical protein